MPCEAYSVLLPNGVALPPDAWEGMDDCDDDDDDDEEDAEEGTDEMDDDDDDEEEEAAAVESPNDCPRTAPAIMSTDSSRGPVWSDGSARFAALACSGRILRHS